MSVQKIAPAPAGGLRGAGAHARGQSLVEFALMAPFLLLLLLAVCDFGFATLTKGNLSYAGRQGARLLESYGATSTDPDTAIISAITTTMQAGGLSLSNLQSITIARANAGDAPSTAPNRVYTFSNGTITGTSGSYTATSTPRYHGDVTSLTIHYHYHGITLLLAQGVDMVDTTYTLIDPDTLGVALPTPAPTPTASGSP